MKFNSLVMRGTILYCPWKQLYDKLMSDGSLSGRESLMKDAIKCIMGNVWSSVCGAWLGTTSHNISASAASILIILFKIFTEVEY